MLHDCPDPLKILYTFQSTVGLNVKNEMFVQDSKSSAILFSRLENQFESLRTLKNQIV